MPITYSIKINQIDVKPMDGAVENIVVCVHWAYIGSDETNSAGFGGSTNFSYTQGDPFTPYADLTEDQVKGWVSGSFSEDQLALMQNAINQQLEVTPRKFPWEPEVEYKSEYVSIPHEEIVKD